ncbi:MAG: hypothetical protein M1839_005306 [Geoglossum umbratile]|nr:MAG: hypothetical protein M1839_005306 [Geoglossum umbratile]
MKVTLELEQPVGNHVAFTTLEYVRGIANLHLWHEEAVSKIVLSLRGRLQAALSKSTGSQDSIPGAADSHKLTKVRVQLFKLSQNIFPPVHVPLALKGFTLKGGTHSFPFEIRFPVLSVCHKPQPWITHLKTTLPPSFEFRAPNHEGSAKVQYWLRVKVQRPGRFKHNPLSEQELTFLPLDPALPPPMLDPAYSRSIQPLGVGNLVSNVPPSTFRSASGLATREGCFVLLEATLPSPAILYIRRTVPMRLFVKTHATLVDDYPQIMLRTLGVAIRTNTTVTIRSDSATWTSSRDLMRISGLELQLIGSHVNGELLYEISKDLWKDATVSDMTPSFTTCTVTQQHSLVVTAGFSYGPEDTDYVETAINVEVHSGVTPAPGVTVMEELDGHHSNEQTVLVPWRVGSERHLGIAQGSPMTVNNVPPPPYQDINIRQFSPQV